MSITESIAQQKHKETNKLTLYMIGHAPDSKYLERLLNAIHGILDGIAFISTDNSSACLDVIKKSGLPFIHDYHVFPKREDFNFSLVRNKALKMANENFGGWLFWLDCDDFIENPENILKLMEQHQDCVAYGLPYEVNERAGNLYKIRIHKDDFHWVNSVHEELVPIESGEKKTLKVISECPVKHMPDEGKGNHDFHISLLKKSSETAANDYCYIAKEYFNSLKADEAIPWIKKAIAIHTFPHEIYNLYMMLGICYNVKDDFKSSEKAWLKGMKVAPYRKEAYYYLAECYGKKGGNDNLYKGLGYISACTAQLDKGEPLQNINIYNSLSYKLHARFLQKFKKYPEALRVIEKIKTPDDESEQIRNELYNLVNGSTES